MMPSWNGKPVTFLTVLICGLSALRLLSNYLEMKLPLVSRPGDLVILADHNIVSLKEIAETFSFNWSQIQTFVTMFNMKCAVILPCIFVWYVIFASKRIFFYPLIIFLSIRIKVIIIVIIIVVPVIVVIQTIFFITGVSRPVNLKIIDEQCWTMLNFGDTYLNQFLRFFPQLFSFWPCSLQSTRHKFELLLKWCKILSPKRKLGQELKELEKQVLHLPPPLSQAVHLGRSHSTDS